MCTGTRPVAIQKALTTLMAPLGPAKGVGGGSTLLHTRHHLPTPAPLLLHLSEARCTRHNFEKPGVRSVARPQANGIGENNRVFRYTKVWVFIISDTYFSSVAPNNCT